MKRQFILIFWVFTALGVQAQGIKFEENISWKQLLEKAKLSKKNIFIDAYTTWCIPCKEMSAEVFPDRELGNYVNSQFISVKVQMDKTKNDRDYVKSWYLDAKKLETDFKIEAYPTILFVTSDGELISKAVGYRKPVELIEVSKKALSDYSEFNGQFTEFKAGKRDTSFLKKLAEYGTKIGQTNKAHQVAQVFINSLAERDLFRKDNLTFTYVHTTKSSDKGFKLFREQAQRANLIFGSKTASQQKVNRVIFLEEIEPHTLNGNPDWDFIQRNINKKYGNVLEPEYYYGVRMVYALDHELWDEFGKYYSLYYKTGFAHSKFHINNLSWSIFEHVDDPKVLDVAIKTMKYNVDFIDKGDPGSMDTYANLMYKAGRKIEAIAAQEKAVQLEEEIAVKRGVKPNPVFKETLGKFKTGIKTSDNK